MNILNKVSVKNLKLNKKRTISTIIGIILSVALICAVATMATSFQDTLVQETTKSTGYFHLKLTDITNENLRELENNRDIKSIYTIYENGYANLENSQNKNKPYLKVLSMNKTSFDYLKYDLTEGRFPENNNEIIINKQIYNSAKVDYKIGDKIKLDIGQRETLDNYKLYPENTYNKEDEKIVNTESSEFTIVGIIGKINTTQEKYYDPGYTAITTNKNTGSKTAYIALTNPKNYEEDIAEILGVSSINKIEKETEKLKYEQYDINEDLLRWEVFAVSDSTITMFYGVIAVVVTIIVFTSIFCIRNSFAIATAEKIKMYGMLASIGATKKQIRKNVIFEGLVLGVIGIPLGILSGIFACFVLIKIVNMLIAEYLFSYIDGMVLKVSILPIILSIVLGIVTIYLSSISSARKASKVSPIENLRNSDDIKIKRNKIKAPKIIEKLFKTGGVLAYKNLKRSKKKYRTTVISLVVSVCVFISMNSVLTYVFGLTNVYYKDVDYNLIVYNNTEKIGENANKIIELEDVKDYYMYYSSKNDLRISDKSKMNTDIELPLSLGYYYDDEKQEEVSTGEEEVMNLWLIGYDNATFEKYAKKAGINPEKVKDTGILYDKMIYQDKENNKTKEARVYTYSQGDTITGKYENKEISIKLGAVTETLPYGKEDYNCNSGYLILNIDEFKDIDFRLQQIYINSNDAEKTEQQIEKINDGIGVINVEEEANIAKAMIIIVKIFLYGFITVITLIGVTNIFNTITSNMELRQKEFAMLKSIGMTKKEFNRMIRLETIFYGAKALIYGIALGLLGTLAIYKAFAVKLDSGMQIPVTPIIISVVGVFVLISIIMKYSIYKINKQNTIETIRKENI